MSSWLNKCHFGDVRDVLQSMIADGVKVQTIITSPPYWGLRSYLPVGHPNKASEIGSEPTLREFIASMTSVMALARQVLADNGTMFLNMGDCYITRGGKVSAKAHAGTQDERLLGVRSGHEGKQGRANGDFYIQPNRRPQNGLKHKDLAGQPWRLALALQDGTCMCRGCGLEQATSSWPAHEGKRICVACFMGGRTASAVTPEAEPWWLRQDIVWQKLNPTPESVTDRCTKAHEYIFLMTKAEQYYFDQEAILEPSSETTHARLSQNVLAQRGSDRAHAGLKVNGPMKAVRRGGNQAHHQGNVKNNRSFDAAMAAMPPLRNKRSVWTLSGGRYKGAHFATFPAELVEPCVVAGAPVGGVVLDIFMGSGTTAQVAERLGRRWIGIDLDDRNKLLQRKRLRQLSLQLECPAADLAISQGELLAHNLEEKGSP